MDELAAAMHELVTLPLTQPETFVRYGLRPPRGLLLYGPPGSGKTVLARAAAHAAGASLMVRSANQLVACLRSKIQQFGVEGFTYHNSSSCFAADKDMSVALPASVQTCAATLQMGCMCRWSMGLRCCLSFWAKARRQCKACSLPHALLRLVYSSLTRLMQWLRHGKEQAPQRVVSKHLRLHRVFCQCC